MTAGTGGPSKPSSLANLKKWLTLPEAARQIALLSGEDVTEADVLQLGLDGKLTLSVRFVNPTRATRHLERTEAEIRRHNQISKEMSDNFQAVLAWPPRPRQTAPSTMPEPEDDERVVTLGDEVYDLQMIGGGRRYVERRYQRLTGGPAVTLVAVDGPFVVADDGTIFALRKELRDHFPTPDTHVIRSLWYPPGTLPDDSYLVIRSAALRELESTLVQHRRPLAPVAAVPPRTCDGAEKAEVAPHGKDWSWTDVKIEFTSDTQVQVTKGVRILRPWNFAEMGFEDRRSKTPTKAWLTLRLLAAGGGQFKPEFLQKKKTEKRVQEIRRLLHEHFQREGFVVPQDATPVVCEKGAFRTVFTIGKRPSYQD